MPTETFNTSPAGSVPTLALRPREAAPALGISERTLWSLTKEGKIPHIRCGRSILYPVDSLRDWLAASAKAGQHA